MSLLLKPIRIGSFNLTNRLVLPPMASDKSKADGRVSEELIKHYAEKSRGGHIGLVIVEHSYVSPEGKASENQLSIADDSLVEDLKGLAKVIQQNGSKAVMQINHAGSRSPEAIIGTIPVGPSSIINPRKGEAVPRELTCDEINNIVFAFKEAARRTKEAGFDGVEVHSAHGYLLNQFFSPLTNKRDDNYGGSTINRIHIHLKIIDAIKSVVGDEYPILLRLGASDFMPGGITIDDSIIAAKEFEKAGLSILDISGGFSGYTVQGLTGQGFFSPLTEAIKQAVSIPVILTGGITEAKSAEKLLQDNKADLIGVGRAVFRDSDWAKKAITSLKGSL